MRGRLLVPRGGPRPLSTNLFPPGPKGPFIFWALRGRRDPLAFVQELARGYGDVVFLRVGRRRVYLVNDPDLVRTVLVDRADAFSRATVTPATANLVGGSLFLSDGPEHARRKRAAQSMIGHDRLDFIVRTSASLAARTASRWERDKPFDLGAAMFDLGLRATAANLFSMEADDELARLSSTLRGAYGAFERAVSPLGPLMDSLPLPSTRRIQRKSEELKAIMDRLVAERLARPGASQDMLALLAGLRFGDGGADRLTPAELRAEAIDLLFGSMAAVAALTWTIYELARNPGAQTAVASSTRSALGGRSPSLADLGRLQLARSAYFEGLRMHPTAWAFGRRAREPVKLGAWEVPAGAVVMVSPYLSQRDPRNFPDPARFDLARWDGPAAAAVRQRLTYFPFGAGPRSCLGEGLAVAQGTATVATFLQTLEFRLAPGAPAKEQAPGLEPVGAFPVIVRDRPEAAA